MCSEERCKADCQLFHFPTHVARYAHELSRLIYSIERNILIVKGVLAALAVIAVIGSLEIRKMVGSIDEDQGDRVMALPSVIPLMIFSSVRRKARRLGSNV